MRTWNRFWRLSGFERGVALEAAVALSASWVGLRLAGFRRWKAALDALTRPIAEVSERDRFDAALEIARVEQSVAQHLFFRPNCLEQSVTLLWLLQRRGIGAELRIGVRKQAGRFEAHAWVERNGVVLSETAENHLHFMPFDGPLGSMEAQTPSAGS
jgi:Transglutaminase-like superfamily